jgi:hypothetical protein
VEQATPRHSWLSGEWQFGEGHKPRGLSEVRKRAHETGAERRQRGTLTDDITTHCNSQVRRQSLAIRHVHCLAAVRREERGDLPGTGPVSIIVWEIPGKRPLRKTRSDTLLALLYPSHRPASPQNATHGGAARQVIRSLSAALVDSKTY